MKHFITENKTSIGEFSFRYHERPTFKLFANANLQLSPAYLEQLVTNFKNSRRSSSVKSFARMSHSHPMTRCESWKPPKYCVFRLRSLRSRGLVSPEISRCSSTIENSESQSRLMMLRKPRMNAEVCSQICVCIRKKAIE